MSITDFLNDTAARTESNLKTAVEIQQTKTFPAPGSLFLERPTWKRIDDAVVVATDLKGSTKISYSRQDRVGARVYQASTGNCARIFQRFDAQFVDIQGDGLFAIFHGEHAVGRAVAAAFTLKSFSASALGPMIDTHLGSDLPAGFNTGLKIGIDIGTLLAKRIGVRGNHNEPVWAGKPVNYATKCAQAADRHELIVTDRFFAKIKDNAYARYTCGCAGGVPDQGVVPLWAETQVETLGSHSSCKVFTAASSWCANHGDQFSAAIESGLTARDDINVAELPPLITDAGTATAA
jgi:class 3 adenylate cyclase